MRSTGSITRRSNGTTNLDVLLDAAGNILSKTSVTEPLPNVGTYTYHPVKRHAVASTSNGWSFTYDANGNMLTGRGATITWYSYNLPNTITNGSLSSQFFYTPDRKYWRQNANYAGGFENTIYIGGLLEKVSSSVSSTEYRHMIRAGTATVIVSRHTNGTNNTYYATQDHLGTTSVITNSSGAVVVSQNFGAYGNRRGSNWQGSPSAPDWTGIASTTRRGYTGHTMVDNVSLIHMNGRMYDPVIARFIQPDPIVQTLNLSQALNPYSYVMNNPLKYIDPSGYSWLSKAWKKVKRFVKKYWKPIIAVVAAFTVGAWAYQAYMSAASSAATAAANAAMSAAVDASIGVSVYTSAMAGASMSAGVIAGMAGGLVAGGITGGFKGAVMGAISGAAFGIGNAVWSGVGNSFMQGTGRALTAGVIGGGTSEVLGGRFKDGFWFAFGASAASSIYQSVVRYRATWATGGDAVQKTEFSPPVEGANNLGTQGKLVTNPDFWAEGRKLSRFFNRIPGMNAIAGMHDTFQIQFSGFQRSLFNVPLMIPAAAITVPALLTPAPFQIVYFSDRLR